MLADLWTRSGWLPAPSRRREPGPRWPGGEREGLADHGRALAVIDDAGDRERSTVQGQVQGLLLDGEELEGRRDDVAAVAADLEAAAAPVCGALAAERAAGGRVLVGVLPAGGAVAAVPVYADDDRRDLLTALLTHAFLPHPQTMLTHKAYRDQKPRVKLYVPSHPGAPFST